MLCKFCANKVGGGGVRASILLRGEGRVIREGGCSEEKLCRFQIFRGWHLCKIQYLGFGHKIR